MSLFAATTLLRRLRADTCGAGLIETAAVLPIMLMAFAGLGDFSMGYTRQLQLQQAAVRTIELAVSTGADSTQQSTLVSEAATAASVTSDKVTVSTWLECGGTLQTDYNGICSSGQQTARYASVRIVDTYQPVMSAFIPGMGSGGVALEGKSTVRLQ